MNRHSLRQSQVKGICLNKKESYRNPTIGMLVGYLLGLGVLEARTGAGGQDLNGRAGKTLTPALQHDHASLLPSSEMPDFHITSACTGPQDSSGSEFTALPPSALSVTVYP